MNSKEFILSIVCAVVLAISVSQGVAAEKAGAIPKSDQVDSAALVVEKIDINRADPTLLTNLPGVGSRTAEKITAYRDAHGPFKSVDDLLKIKGIGPDKLEKIRPLVTVS